MCKEGKPEKTKRKQRTNKKTVAEIQDEMRRETIKTRRAFGVLEPSAENTKVNSQE